MLKCAQYLMVFYYYYWHFKGRTYKYYTGKALFEFGHGLSLSTFELECASKVVPAEAVQHAASSAHKYSCTVSNTGGMAGDEVVQVYHSAGAAIRSAAMHPVPIKSLVAFDRVRIAKGGKAEVAFDLSEDAFMLVNKAGVKTLYKGERTLIFSNGAGQIVNIKVTL